MKKLLISFAIMIFTLALVLNGKVYAVPGRGNELTDGGTGGSKSTSKTESVHITSMFGSAQNFIKRGEDTEQISSEEAQKGLLGLGGILMSIGILVALVTGLILGVKYMISGADTKANLKQVLIWWVVGVIVVLGAIGIFNIVVRTMNNVLN